MTDPKIDVSPVVPGQDAALYLDSLTDRALSSSFMDFYVAAKRLPPIDPALVEMIRIRNGVAQSCEYCLSVRLDGGHELAQGMTRTVVDFEESALTDREKAALRLATAFLERPSDLTQEARDEALKHFSPEEIVGLMLRLASFLVNKPRAALGIDAPLDPTGLTAMGPGSTDDFIAHGERVRQAEHARNPTGP